MSNLHLATRMSWIKPSPSVAANNRAMELKAEGRPVLNLAAGEPDFDTPVSIQDAGVEAIRTGRTRYTQTAGDPDLRKAIIEKMKTDIGLDYGLDQVQVSNGAKQVLYHALTATVSEGDEVIIPAPYWVSYPDMVTMQGGKPVLVDCKAENGFRMTAEALEAAITERTKWLILNVPNNPGGVVYSKEEIASITDVLRRHPQVWLATDDIYEVLRFDSDPVPPLKIAPDLADRTLLINGVSKTYAMTGWRIGYGVGPKALIKAMNIVQSQVCTSASSIAQFAATAALRGPQNFIDDMCSIYSERASVAADLLDSVSGLKAEKPAGGFFIFTDCRELIGKKTPSGSVIESGMDVVSHILDDTGVILVGGEAFGVDGFFRLSIATDMETIKKGCGKIASAIGKLD
nr:aminotransferase class I/II-fold pyridoxal phosphate-dependent enzyme [uncultured Cohaesibacter sp.]